MTYRINLKAMAAELKLINSEKWDNESKRLAPELAKYFKKESWLWRIYG